MNDKHVGGYISLTTHELNINESKYSGKGVKFSALENSTHDRGERGGGRGRMMLSNRGEVDRFNRDASSRRHGGPRNRGEGSAGDNRSAVRNNTPRAANASERKTFRLRKV